MSVLGPRLNRWHNRVVVEYTLRDAEELAYILEGRPGWEDDVRAIRDIIESRDDKSHD